MHRHVWSVAARWVVWVAIFAVPSGVLAQGVTGSAVTGTVTQEGGGPLEGVSLQLKNPATGETFRAVTGSSGQYFFDNIPAGGPYIIEASAVGYPATTREDIVLTLGQRLDVDLLVRRFKEEIVVVGHRDQLADHARTGASTTVKGSQIAKLPLQGRNFVDLVQTAPQINGNNIGGQNNRFNNIQIDGIANNDLFGLSGTGTPGDTKPISVEAIQEFVVQVAPFDGRQSNFTGGLVNAITKSGTNEFHGSLFSYYQNKLFAGNRDEPTFTQYYTWQFGGVVSGPIVKDKVHFFIAADFQQRKSAFGSRFFITGDDAADRARTGFTKADVQRLIDIMATKYNITGQGDALPTNLANPDRNVFVKVTTSVIPNSHLEVSYNFVNNSRDVLLRDPTSVFVPGRMRDGYQLSHSGYIITNSTNTGRVKLTSNWGDGKLSNEFLAGFSFIRDKRELPGPKAPLILVKVGTIGSSDSWLAAGAERFSQANSLDQNIYTVSDNLTFALDRHRLTVGTSNEFLKIRNLFLQAAIGVWAFDSLDAFDAGTPLAFQRRFGVSDMQEPGVAKFSVSQFGFYVQDEWSLLRNLTLTPGVRMDVPFLTAAIQNPALVNNTLFQIDTSKVPSGNLLWSPRLGVNWDVEGTSDTIIRGGIGVFTGRPPYVWVSNAYGGNGLSQVELRCTAPGQVPRFNPDPNNPPSNCAGGTGPPAPPTNQGEIDYFDPNTKYPQNLRLAVGVDKRLPWGLVATGDFLYTRDVNGWYTTDENLVFQGTSGDGRALYGTFAPAGFTASPSRVDATHLLQAVKVFNKNGGQVYSMTLQLQKQMRLFGVSAAYTYSSSQDRISFTSSQAFSNFQFAPVDGSLENRNVRPSAFDRPHKITITGTASLPFGFGLGVIYVRQSGTPYTWTVNGDVNGDGINGNDIVFVPADASQISLQNPAQY